MAEREYERFYSATWQVGRVFFWLLILFIFSVGTYYSIYDISRPELATARNASPVTVMYNGPMYFALGFIVLGVGLYIGMHKSRMPESKKKSQSGENN